MGKFGVLRHYCATYFTAAFLAAGSFTLSACTMELGIYDMAELSQFTAKSSTNGNINENNLLSATFVGYCTKASQIVISSNLVPNLATFTCSANSTWIQSVDLSALPSTYIGKLVFTATSTSGDEQTKDVDITLDNITLDNIPPTIALNTQSVVNSVNHANYSVSGSCSEEGEPVYIDVSGVTKSTPCTSGAFATFLDLTSLSGSSVVISATHADPAGNSRSATASVQRHTTIPTLTSFSINNNAATTTSASATLNASVTGATQMYVSDSAGCSTGGSWVAYAASSAWTLPTANATNTVYAKYRDNWGNETVCTSDSILFDNGAPTLSITSPLAGAYVTDANVASFTISGSCSENARSITLSGPNSFVATTTCNGTSFSAILNVAAIPEGSFQLDAEISDIAGNSTTASSPLYNKDTAEPTGTLSINAGAASTSSLTVSLGLTYSDAGQMYVTNTSGCSANGVWETSAATKSWTLPTASALNTVYAKFRDAAGNESPCYSDDITHIATPITVSLASPAPGSYINLGNANAFTVSGACSENGVNVTIAVPGLASTTATCTSGAWTKTLNLSGLTDGSIDFTISHATAPDATQSYTKETVAPTITSFAINGGAAYISSLSATLDINVTGATEMYITDSALCLSGGTWETYATTQSRTLATANAANTVYFKARDAYGNESNCVSDSITHDSVIPTIAILGSAAGTWVNNSNKANFPMNGTCSEYPKSFTLAVTSTAVSKTVSCVSPGTWTTTVNMSTLADNAVTPYEIVVTLSRTSGNSASASASYYKDIVAPAVPTLSNLPIFSDSTMNITIGGTDVTQYQYFVILPGDILTSCNTSSTFSGSKIAIATPITDTMTSTGTYKVCTRSWDEAGNFNTVSSATSFVHDSQGPQVLSVTSSAADGVYDVGVTIPIKVIFDENVTVTGTPQLALETGATDRVINYVSGTGTTTLTFNYIVQSGDESTDLDYVSTSSLSLNGGTLKDTYGQDANLTLPTPGSTSSLGGQKNIALSVTTGLTPTVKGYLTGITADNYTLATVSGSNITHYKYAVITSGTCAAATYSFAQPKASPISHTTSVEGPHTLCVIGGSSSTTFQPAADALSFSWIVENLSLVGISTPAQNRVIEGGANQTITFTMSSAKNYDIDVYYHVSGDAVNPTNHNAASGTITFPAGSTSQSITVSFPDNAVVEGEKLLNVYVTGSNSQVMGVAEKYIAQFFIKDNDSSLTITDFKMSTMTACSITSDNALRCLGHNGRGTVGNGNTIFQSFATVVTPGTGYASVSVGREMTCAITTLGALYCWGDIESVATTVTTPMLIDAANSYLSVAVGNRHACGITTANKLRCWGRNTSYQLGDGTNVSKAAVSIDATEDYKFITTGAFNTCGITSNDVLKCWGESTDFAGGTGTLIQTPTIIDSGVAYKAASIGTSHACGITTAGTMKCWGANVSSQLGDGTTTTSMTPVLVDSTPAYTKVSVSQTLNTIKNNDFTCALTVAGTVKCWGYNNQQLGDGSYTLRSTPVLADSGALYISIEVSGHRTCGITTDGALKCWGAMETNANFYHFGMQGQYYLSRFTKVQPEFNFTQYSGFNYFGSEIGNRICGIANNKLYCWGSNDTVNSLSGDRTSTANRRTAPILIDGNTDYASITEGHQQDTCAITTDGYIKCWGYNRYGEFGTGLTVGNFAKRPVVIDNFNKYSKVASQYETVCGITQTGVLKCSGGNDSYQLGDGTTTHATTMTTVDPGVTYQDIALGQSHVCGITTSDVLKCWGGNSQGQVGVGTTSTVTRPTVVDSGVSYKKVISGASWNCAITTANKLKCWGGNGVNQLGTGDTNNKLIPTAIDAARDYMDVGTAWSNSCALDTSGYLRCWGSASGHMGLATGVYENGMTYQIASPQLADPGVTYTKVFVRQGATCGITTGGDTRCAGRFMGANLGIPDSGVIGISSPDTQAGVIHIPTYMQKWFGL